MSNNATCLVISQATPIPGTQAHRHLSCRLRILISVAVCVALLATACGSTGETGAAQAVSGGVEADEPDLVNDEDRADDDDDDDDDELDDEDRADADDADDDDEEIEELGDDDDELDGEDEPDPDEPDPDAADTDELEDDDAAASDPSEDSTDASDFDASDTDTSDEGDAAEGDDNEAESASDAPAGSASELGISGMGQDSTWQPWDWNGWQKFPSLYFAAEPEGFLSEDQMDKVSDFSLAIIEFRAGQFAEEETSGEWAGGDLAGHMEQQAVRLRQAHPDGPPVLTYRSGMWAGSMFSKQWEALQRQDLFLADSRLCDGFISYPKDVDESGFQTDLQHCRWDFTNPDAQTEYVSMVAAAAQEQTAGVFFDNGQSVACDDTAELTELDREQRRQLAEATEQTYRAAFTELVSNGKYPILSTTNSFSDIGPPVPWENDCPNPEESLIAALDGVPFARNNEFWMWNLGELATAQIQNSIRETELGIPIIVHMPWFPNDRGCLEGCRMPDGSIREFTQDEFLEFGMAAFLVSMGPGSYFGFSDMQSDTEGGGWFDVSWDYFPQYESIVTGAPIGPAEVSADGATFTRSFENGTVWVNSVDGSYSIELSS